MEKTIAQMFLAIIILALGSIRIGRVVEDKMITVAEQFVMEIRENQLPEVHVTEKHTFCLPKIFEVDASGGMVIGLNCETQPRAMDMIEEQFAEEDIEPKIHAESLTETGVIDILNTELEVLESYEPVCTDC